MAFVVQRCRMSRFEVLGPGFESLPVPVFGAEGLRIARMLAPTRVDAETQRRWVSPPSYVVEQRADTGAFVEARAVSPGVFGREDDPAVELGEILRPQGFADATRRLYELLDAVLPAFAAGPLAGGQALTLAAVSREAREAFFALAEAPLVPYYRSLGKAFFAFLDRSAEGP